MEAILRKVLAQERLPEIGINVFVKTVFMVSGIETVEYLYGYMDEDGDLIKILSHEKFDEDNYGWKFEECVEYWLEEMELPTDERYEKLKSLIETTKDEHAQQIAISPEDIPNYNFQNGYGHALCNLHWKMKNLEYVGSESKSSVLNVCEDCGEPLTGGYEVKCGKCWVKISNYTKPF